MLHHWVVIRPVVGHQIGPPPPLTPVLATTVEQVTVEEHHVPRLQLGVHQRVALFGVPHLHLTRLEWLAW